jgi:hypothetical protein
MFTPFQSNSDELTMTADRASTALVDNVLLVDTPGNFNYNRPNVIDLSKLDMDDPSHIDFEDAAVRTDLGLSSDRVYNVHVTLTVGSNTFDFGQDYPIRGAFNVGQSKRIVVIANTCTLTDSNGNNVLISVPVDSTKSVMGILTVAVW